MQKDTSLYINSTCLMNYNQEKTLNYLVTVGKSTGIMSEGMMLNLKYSQLDYMQQLKLVSLLDD